MNTDTLIDRYLELRAKKDAATARFKDVMAPVGAEMTEIEGQLLDQLNNAGLKNMKGNHGTVYITDKTSIKPEDWEEFLEFVKENDLFHMIERRPAKTAATEWLDEHGELPPGLSMSTYRACTVRKS